MKSSFEYEYADALKAVKGGDEGAKTKIAWFLLSGLGGAENNEEKAVELLEERVKEKDSEAMWMLGVCCEFGVGMDQDIRRGMKLYLQSGGKKNAVGKSLVKRVKFIQNRRTIVSPEFKVMQTDGL